MKEKRVLLILVFALISIALLSNSLVFADDAQEIEKSYNCLKSQLNSSCGNTQNTLQASFNLLAIAYDSSLQSDCKTSLNNKKQGSCWSETSSGSCTVKSTAIATLALKHVNSDVSDSINWLKNHTRVSSDLIWYLEIDANNVTQCTINNQAFGLGSDKRLTGANPAGLSKTYNNYWFQITDLGKSYNISCDKEFVTALLYKRPGSGTYYVSSETHSAAAYDYTTESVNGLCFSASNQCDYEGTLWAIMALIEADEDTTQFIPYMTALSDDEINAKYLPLAFLYKRDSSSDDYLQGLLSLQKENKYWQASGNKFYDSSVAMFALQGSTAQQLSNAKSYLLSVRNSNGCWPSDTAMILYSGWPKSVSQGSAPSTSRDCAAFGNYCVSASECSLNNSLPNFDCTSLSQVCCSTQPRQETCQEKSGIICKTNERCSETEVPSADGLCCLASCQEIQTTSECEQQNYYCSQECSDNEEEKSAYSNSCGLNQICCAEKAATKSNNLWLIILLIILIILVILAIIFRNQLKIWWFKIKSGAKSKKGPEPTSRPAPSFPPPRPPLMPRQIIPRPPRPPVSARPVTRQPVEKSQKDKEFEETMKKLRDMSK